MRTAIYVYKPSSVTIHTKQVNASEASDAKIQICRYNKTATPTTIGTQQLDPGIYLITSSRGLEVTGLNIEAQIIPDDKDTWPDTKANVIALEPGATADSVKAFFKVAKSLDVDH